MIDAAVRGEVRVVLNRQALDLYLTEAELAAFEAAKARRYLMLQVQQPQPREAWLYWCKAHGEPCVVVTLRPRVATARLDMFTTGERLTAFAQSQLSQLLLRETGWVSFLDGFYVGPDICESRYVPLSRAEAVAAALYEIARASLDEPRPPRRQGLPEHGVV